MNQKNFTPQQQIGMITASLAVIMIFAGFLWIDINALFDAETHGWKWYAALIGGILCLLCLLTGLLTAYLNLKRYLQHSRERA